MLTVLVTGATGGIGLQTAKVLAGMGHSVLIHGRDPRKGAAAVAAVRAAAAAGAVTAGANGAGADGSAGALVRFVHADFASLRQVERLAAEVNATVPRLDVLINNAGCANLRRKVTTDGYENTFAVNHLAPFLLTHLLLDKLHKSGPARIVNVASRAHRNQELDFDDLMSEREYRVMRTYGRSKLANILFTRALARRLKGSQVTANSLHPGLIATGIGQTNALARLGWKLLVYLRGGISVVNGAKTSVYLATSPEVAGLSSGYYVKCRLAELQTRSEAVAETVSERLWTVSERLVGLPCSF
ncbi:MAG: SDR family NAD(P)-dependent oxidoreductase [Proteobacteria bacterium]|nr:SDR family NAD(P)-dependent oxidoreductase [Pseudomonadota bacterium]